MTLNQKLIGLLVFSTLFHFAFCQWKVRRCVRLTATGNGTDVQLSLLRDSRILPHVYRGEGPCTDIVFAGSFRIGGTCVDLDVTKYNQTRKSQCQKETGSDLEFRKCVWNSDSVSDGGIAVSIDRKDEFDEGYVTVEYFRHKSCKPHLLLDYAVVQMEKAGNKEEQKGPPPITVDETENEEKEPEMDPSSLGYCIYLRKPSKDGDMLTLGLFRDKRVLPQWYDYSGRCREIVHVDSFRISGMCSNFDVHPPQLDVKDRCEHLKAKDKREFRKCYWNSDTVFKWGRVSASNAKIGSLLLVELFDKADCKDQIDQGYILVKE